MVDILLVQPPIHDFYLTAKRTIPYGLASIAASLTASGFSVDILDGLATSKSRTLPYPPEMSYLVPFYGAPDISPFGLFHPYRHYGYSFEHMARMAGLSGARIVGISSLFTPYADEALLTANSIRAALPHCRIVLGGHHPTALPAAVMADPSVDFVLRGEGEVAMPALARALTSGGELSRVPGIVYRKEDGTLHISEPAVMVSLDSHPLPDRNRINNRFYQRGKKGTTVVVTSRGCPMKCSYCALGNRKLTPFRTRSVDAVLTEIGEAVLAHGARFIDFEDENLSFNRSWFLSLLHGISERFGDKKPELRAMNGLFPPTLDDAVAGAMKTAGFNALNLSLGSACPDQLKRFHRPDVRKAFVDALALAEKHGMEAVGYIIVGAPGQYANDSIEDLLFLAGHRVLAGVSVYYPAPASADYETCRQLGLLPQSFSLMRSSALPISHTTTRLETVTLMRLGRIINFMKHLVDRKIAIPRPERFDIASRIDSGDRETAGIHLLSGFLRDGLIRGLTPEGAVYEHAASGSLIERFLTRLRTVPVKGVKGVGIPIPIVRP
ncbi:MAG: cobalamin-dependent protein [Pseudomonadota bacterium]